MLGLVTAEVASLSLVTVTGSKVASGTVRLASSRSGVRAVVPVGSPCRPIAVCPSIRTRPRDTANRPRRRGQLGQLVSPSRGPSTLRRRARHEWHSTWRLLQPHGSSIAVAGRQRIDLLRYPLRLTAQSWCLGWLCRDSWLSYPCCPSYASRVARGISPHKRATTSTRAVQAHRLSCVPCRASS